MVSGRQAKKTRRRGAGADVDTDAELAAAYRILQQRAAGFSGGIEDLSREVNADPLRLLPILHSRALRRAATNAERSELLSAHAWRIGAAISAADQVLERLGTNWYWSDTGATLEERWLAELRSGLDAFARICWCLRFGYSIAGVAIARRFMERWTYNLASSTNVWRDENETDEDYIDRVWSAYDQLLVGRTVSAEWAVLSEVLHGREATIGPHSIAVDFDTSLIDRARLHKFVASASEIALQQVRGGISSSARDAGDESPNTHSFLQAPIDRFPRVADVPDFLFVFFEPLTYHFTTSASAATYSGWGKTYRRITAQRSAVPVDIEPFDSWMAIEERWARMIDEANRAFGMEQAVFKDAFDSTNMEATIVQYQAISEMADLAADSLSNGPHRQALKAAAAALESSWVLWLQDVDDSMTCMRSTLELTAQARAFRTKPSRAAKLAARGALTTPHRWMEAAGWGRLSAFVRALGEFSHVQARSRHSSSRELLNQIQRHPVAGSAENTARARALEEIAMMLAHEVSQTLDVINPNLAKVFREGILGSSESEIETSLVDWLDRALNFREHEFGDAEFDPSTRN